MRKDKKTIWSVGATSKIAIELQRLWAKEAYNFVLVSRDKRSLQDIKRDLKVRGAGNVETHSLEELSNMKPDMPMDILLISLGSLSEQKRWEHSKDYRNTEWVANTSLPMDWIEWGASKVEEQRFGHICVMTSVAADRAKKSNYGYGAAKAALDFYLEGVAHRLNPIGNVITILKPGPTKTPMTSNVDATNLADPKTVAASFHKAISKSAKVAYAPKHWKYIMMIIKFIPRRIWFKTNL